ncbi:MAG: serine hydrolase domain-containing protein [Acidimicrobiales bacterium]
MVMVRDETARALAHRLATEQSECRLPSIAAGLVRDGNQIWFGSAGEVDGARPTDETQYRCGSISKTFVAVEVMRLRDEGLVDLSDPIDKHLPEVTELRCTIAQLLSHTSGLRAETAGPWWERTPGVPFKNLLETSVRFVDVLERPGRRFHYSNTGYAILGELIARLRRRPWDDVVNEELLRPLGMLRTTTHPVEPHSKGFGVHPHADVVLNEPEHDAVSMAPAGQLWTTIGDLCRWSAVLAGLRPEVLSPQTAAEMREPQAVSDLPGLPWTAAHGLGLQLFNRGGTRSYGHNGSMPGWLAILRVDAGSGLGASWAPEAGPRAGDAVAILLNATSGLGLTLESDLLSILATYEPREPEPWRPSPGGVSAELLEITGAWYWGTSGFVLSIDRDGLLELHALGLGREASFRPVGDGSFVGLSGYYAGETLRVVHRPDFSVSHLDIGSFVLTRAPYDATVAIPGGVDDAGWVGGATERTQRTRRRSPRRKD